MPVLFPYESDGRDLKNSDTRRVSLFFLDLAAVFVLILVIILVGVFVLAIILALILIIHISLPPLYACGYTAILAYPFLQDLSFALKRMLTVKPAIIAVAIPPAVAFKPPVKMPINPSC